MERHQRLDLITHATPNEVLRESKTPINEVLRPSFPVEKGRVFSLLVKVLGLVHPSLNLFSQWYSDPTERQVRETLFIQDMENPESYSSLSKRIKKHGDS